MTTPNPFYTPSGTPQTLSRESSALLRQEFTLIQAGFTAVSNFAGLNSGTDTGTANAIVITPSPAMTAYNPFSLMTFLAANTNTSAAVTINANGLGPVSITRPGGIALQPGDIQAGGMYQVILTSPSTAQLQVIPLSGNASGPINFGKANAVASAATVVLDNMTANYGHITGTTAITAVTLAAGSWRQVVFDGALTLTNSANLVLPSGQNITTAAGDAAVFVGDGAGKTLCVSYAPVAGQSMIKLASATLGTAAVAINFLNVFSSFYDNYLVVIENLGGDGVGGLQIQIAVAGAAVSTASYFFSGNSSAFTSTGANTVFGANSSPATAQKLTNAGPAIGGNLGGQIFIGGVNSTFPKSMSSQLAYQITAGTSFNTDICGGIFGVGAASGFRLVLSTGGNFAAGSTVKVFGLIN